MSAEAIQKKLYKAYGKVAKKMGRSAQSMIYRLTDFIDQPDIDTHFIKQVPFSVSADESYGSTLGEDELFFWFNGIYEKDVDQVRVGDFIKENETGEMYVVRACDFNLPIKGMRLTDRITVERVEKAVNLAGDYEMTTTTIVENYPIEIIRSNGVTGGNVLTATKSVDGMFSGEGKTWAPVGSIKNGDIVTDQYGITTQVVGAQYDNEGLKLILQEFTVDQN